MSQGIALQNQTKKVPKSREKQQLKVQKAEAAIIDTTVVESGARPNRCRIPSIFLTSELF